MLKWVKYTSVVVMLFAYVTLVLGNTLALAVVPLFAGIHDVVVTTDGEHLDIVFGHHHLNQHHQAYSHEHPHDHPDHHHSTDNGVNPFFGDHNQPHSDHVFHLSAGKKMLMLEHAITPSYDDPGVHLGKFPITKTITFSFVEAKQNINLLAHPPPDVISYPGFLRTIVTRE